MVSIPCRITPCVLRLVLVSASSTALLVEHLLEEAELGGGEGEEAQEGQYMEHFDLFWVVNGGWRSGEVVRRGEMYLKNGGF